MATVTPIFHKVVKCCQLSACRQSRQMAEGRAVGKQLFLKGIDACNIILLFYACITLYTYACMHVYMYVCIYVLQYCFIALCEYMRM